MFFFFNFFLYSSKEWQVKSVSWHELLDAGERNAASMTTAANNKENLKLINTEPCNLVNSEESNDDSYNKLKQI